MKEKKAPRSIRLVTLATIILAILTMLGALRIVTWVVQPEEVLVIKNDPFPVKPLEVKAGQRISMDIDYCKKQKVDGKTKVFLIGETGGNKPELRFEPEEGTKPGCRFLKGIELPIPGNVPTDTYHILFEVTYKINPIKGDKLTVFRSRSFKITNPQLKQGDARIER